MGLKKSIVFVGAVLVLAACDRAGSPTGPMSVHDGAAAAAKEKGGPLPTTTTQSRDDGPSGGCVWIRGGGDSVVVCPE
jgi:hypothetical protein